MHLERSNLAQSAVVSLATFAAFALLSLVLAYWAWAWLAPSPAPRAPAAAETAGRASSAGALFGSAKDGAGAAMSAGEVLLMGVVAESDGRPGHAVLRLGAKKTVAVPQGGDIASGLRLAEVHADHVILERNGARETLAWPQKSGK